MFAVKRRGRRAAIALRERLAKAPHRLPFLAARERHDDVQALAAGGLEERHEAEARPALSRTSNAASTTSRQGRLSSGSRSRTIRSGARAGRPGSPSCGTRSRRTGRATAGRARPRHRGSRLSRPVPCSASAIVLTASGMPVSAWRWKKQSLHAARTGSGPARPAAGSARAASSRRPGHSRARARACSGRPGRTSRDPGW